MILGYVRFTPEEREELAQAIGRLIVWLARVLHVPWWASLLLLLAFLVGVFAAAVWKPKPKWKSTTAPRRPAVDTRPVHDFAFCGHCGHIVPPERRAAANRIPLCHSRANGQRNCFQLVRAHGHKADGTCRCTDRGE